MGALVEEHQSDMGMVRKIVHDQLLDGSDDQVPVILVVHGLGVLQDDHVLLTLGLADGENRWSEFLEPILEDVGDFLGFVRPGHHD